MIRGYQPRVGDILRYSKQYYRVVRIVDAKHVDVSCIVHTYNGYVEKQDGHIVTNVVTSVFEEVVRCSAKVV